MINNLILLPMTYDSYRDFRDDETAQAISHALGITGKWNGGHLVEVRESSSEIAISAHSTNLFKTVKSRPDGIEMVTTNPSDRTQRTVLVNHTDDSVTVMCQEWDSASGPVGEKVSVELSDDELKKVAAETTYQTTEAMNLFKPHYIAE